MTTFERDESVKWSPMRAKIRLVTEYRVEIYHELDTDTGKELGRMILPRQAVSVHDDVLLEAARTRETIPIEVDLAEVLKAAREMK